MSRTAVTVLILTLAFALLPVQNSAATPTRAPALNSRQPATAIGPSTEEQRRKALNVVASSPLAFEPNLGQAPAGFDFVARNASFAALVGPGGAEVQFAGPPRRKSAVASGLNPSSLDLGLATGTAPPFRLMAVGGNKTVVPVPTRERPGRTNYFLGSDRSKWRTNVRSHEAIEYRNVYPGVDWVFYGRGHDLEHDFVVGPQADPSVIRLRVGGGYQVDLQANGDLLARAREHEVRQQRPVAYQMLDGVRRPVQCSYTVRRHGEVGFKLGAFDHSRTLVIDPVISYSVWLAPDNAAPTPPGSSGELITTAVASDAEGSAYVTGVVGSEGLPVVNPYQSFTGGSYDAFIAKILPDASGYEYCTYLGGSWPDEGKDIAVDALGNAYILGQGGGPDFPVNQDGGNFIAKLSPDGDEILYLVREPTNSGNVSLFSLAVTSDGVVVAGGAAVDIGELPAELHPLQPLHAGGPSDAYIMKLDEAGAPVFATYIGGGDSDHALDVAVDSSGNAVLVGTTWSTDLPVANAFQPTFAGGQRDGFVTKVNADGTAIVFSSYFGGTEYEDIQSVGVDSADAVWMCGQSYSSDLPVVNAAQATYGGDGDAFVAKVASSGAVLLVSTYLGGTLQDQGLDVVVTSAGIAYVAGVTFSNDLAVVDAVQPTNGSAHYSQADLFVAKMVPSGGAFSYLTYLGSPGDDNGNARDIGLATDSLGSVYVAAYVSTVEFPVLDPFEPFSDGNDSVLVKISDSPPLAATPAGIDVSVESAATTVAFANVTTAGTTSVSTTLAPPAAPSGFVANSVYFDIETTASVNGAITVTVPYNPTSVTDPYVLRLYHYDSGLSSWVDITTFVDAVNHTVSGVTTSLSPFVVGVPDCPPIAALGHAYVWVGLKNSDAVGIRFDLRAEVYVNGALIGSGQLDSVPGGSSGFNNARLHDIPLVLSTPSMACAGSTLEVKLFVRNACSGSGKNSGTARLWYNDAGANTNVSIVIPGVTDAYYLLNAGTLAATAGAGPRKSLDVSAGAKCSPFKPFGTWSLTY